MTAAHADPTYSDRHVGWVNQIGAGSWSEPMKLGGPVGAASAKQPVHSSGPVTGTKPKSSASYQSKSKSKSKTKAAKKPAGHIPKKAYSAAKPKAQKKPVKVAALGNAAYSYSPPKQSITGGGVRWVASASCLVGSLRSVVAQLAANYGSVTVSSTCRSKKHNRRVGGARHSHHLTGNAVDFRVHGNVRAAYAFLRSHGSVGGFKHYGGGRFHIDTGPKRSW